MTTNTLYPASLNAFGHDDLASPSRDQLITLTIGQLQDLIAQAVTQAVEKAIQPLQDRISALEEERDLDRQDIATLRESVASLVSTQEQDTTRICLDIAYDRQRLAKLEKTTPGPTDEERIEKIEGYLKDKKAAGLKPEASFTEARAYLEVSRSQFSQLISKLDPRDFVISPHPLNHKSKMIGLSYKI